MKKISSLLITRWRVLKLVISRAKDEKSHLMRKLIDDKVDWWESSLMIKSIDKKGELGFGAVHTDGHC